MTSPVAYWHADIEAKLAEVTAAGATVKEPAHDVGGGRQATVTDPDAMCWAASGSVSPDPRRCSPVVHRPVTTTIDRRYRGSYGNLAAASSSKLTPKPG